MQLSKPRVVIIGGGFGGLEAAKQLEGSNLEVVLIDKTNHHLFQPLLYQVAISALSPGDIATPLRGIFNKSKNVQVIMNKAVDINTDEQYVELEDGRIEYDYLIAAPGAKNSYFGNNRWEKYAPGLKSIQDALRIREMVLSSFEKAERYYKNKDKAKKYLTFAIIGGGPTGVELAGAISEIGRDILLPDFPLLKNEDINVFLVEGGDRLLKPYPEDISEYTREALENIGVKVLLNTKVKDVSENVIYTGDQNITSACILWAAGNEGSPLIKKLNTEIDKAGRAIVNKDLTIPGYDNVFVVGDASYNVDGNGVEVPGVAPAARQEAEYAAYVIKYKIASEKREPFIYNDKGSLATIGKAKAVAVFGKTKFKGFFAWLVWSFVHIFFIIDFRNRIRVMLEWIYYYIRQKTGARLIFNKKDEEEKEPSEAEL